MLIGIIGGGAWGTTLGQLLIDNGHQAIIYDNKLSNVDNINAHTHPFFKTKLPKGLKATTKLADVVSKTNYLLLAVPTKVMREVLQQINEKLVEKTFFICVSKGLEPATGKTMSQLVREEINQNYFGGYAILTGPSHAEEVIKRHVTLLTVAADDEDFSQLIQRVFSNNKYMRIYTSKDIIGLEVSGASKNAIAVVSGILTGFGMGENARAALITRGILEIARVVEYYGGNRQTAFGLAGVGDLIVTASSEHSRNFRAGKKIGQGFGIKEIYQAEAQTIEGFRSIKALYNLFLAKKLYLPIIETAYQVIFNGLPIEKGLLNLLSNTLKEEKIE